ncbi:MAG: alpha/beta fold hydrolase [Xanthobacteraceae bacterium]|nr:alpha/beta fold hydrolase [Xanthobacteraceae bacterium]
MSLRLPGATHLLALAIVIMFSAEGRAQQRWLSVPSTPSLPVQTSGGHIDRKDALLWYATYGDETKPAVLLLHGGGGSSDYWGHLVRDLVRDYRVIVFDCRGQGRSTNDAATLSYEQMANDAIAVLNQLGHLSSDGAMARISASISRCVIQIEFQRLSRSQGTPRLWAINPIQTLRLWKYLVRGRGPNTRNSRRNRRSTAKRRGCYRSCGRHSRN